MTSLGVNFEPGAHLIVVRFVGGPLNGHFQAVRYPANLNWQCRVMRDREVRERVNYRLEPDGFTYIEEK